MRATGHSARISRFARQNLSMGNGAFPEVERRIQDGKNGAQTECRRRRFRMSKESVFLPSILPQVEYRTA